MNRDELLALELLAIAEGGAGADIDAVSEYGGAAGGSVDEWTEIEIVAA